MRRAAEGRGNKILSLRVLASRCRRCACCRKFEQASDGTGTIHIQGAGLVVLIPTFAVLPEPSWNKTELPSVVLFVQRGKKSVVPVPPREGRLASLLGPEDTAAMKRTKVMVPA
jgi:hypothetical protein